VQSLLGLRSATVLTKSLSPCSADAPRRLDMEGLRRPRERLKLSIFLPDPGPSPFTSPDALDSDTMCPLCASRVSLSPLCNARSTRSLSRFSSQSRRRSAVSTRPWSRATRSGVWPSLSAWAGLAPRRRRVRTTAVWPLAAAKCNDVEPGVPTIGRELLRCFSEVYSWGNL
jgi:hypothetical protein